MQFNQTALGSKTDDMDDFGMAYIPKACLASSNTTGSGCRLHLHFHGTNMNIQGCHRLKSPWECGKDTYGRYVSTPDSAHSGFNSWAEANKIVVVYPQTMDKGWRNSGDSGDDYAWKSAAQMTTVQRIMQAFQQKPGLLSCELNEQGPARLCFCWLQVWWWSRRGTCGGLGGGGRGQ
jgi:hypothetical protein